MALPETVEVRLSSEEAGSISITPVVVQQMPLKELLDAILGVTGKDSARIGEVLERGTLLAGATRFRWSGFQASMDEIAAVLESFPGSDPSRPFVAGHCVRVILRGRLLRLELSREIASERGFLRKGSLWDAVMGLAAENRPQYVEYSFREHADRYRLPLTAEMLSRLQEAASLTPYAKLARQLRSIAADSLELLTVR